ncbi:MFS transporter [Aspergillus glaucus CBS 516.65]|uniref:Major facilitator superfamily (MFS) profile domain-containing protein n=1 Tax=Aspergillus glaucus CBS 516.65 TaxID=1160497 RepID=A0A1L9V4Z6_ASPGL|nr:hypothetical protein ASPGLDRAFT_1508125 [Aspergillus glaucus CBS 516.65]OJJ78987.1 hypothetical protein ASPGLDRAFT_1508125 [Aspergillus glaucus CBS 516.65]
MIETIRETAFGKLMRMISHNRILQYPEEIDPETCSRYVLSETNLENLESNTHGEPGEEWGLFTVMSQASRRPSATEPAPAEKLSSALVSNIAIGWSSNDTQNPQNWSTGKKLFVSSQVWLLTFAIYIGSAIYSPGIPQVSEQFGVSSVAATLGLTLFVLGYGIGPMFYSPLSELPAVGRGPTFVLTAIAFVFLNFGVIYAKNFGTLLAFRFLTGLIGSPPVATGAASMADIWGPLSRDYMIAIWSTFAIAAPVMGPFLGGFASSANGWTWTIWQLVWVSGFAAAVCFFCLPETYTPNILYRRARRIRNVTANSAYISESEIELQNMTTKGIIFEALVRPFQLCFLEPIILSMNLYISFIYGMLYIWFEAFPIVFQEMHGFNPGEGGLAFFGILVSVSCVAIPPYFFWKYFYQSKKLDTEGNLRPEEQLPPACIGCLSIPISLFSFGWTGNFSSVHWIVPIICSMFFALGGCLIFNCIFSYQAQAYPKYAASVLAGNDFMRSCFGAGFPLFASAMFHNLGVGWACTLLGCLTILFVPMPFILYFYGTRIRMASKYARHDIQKGYMSLYIQQLAKLIGNQPGRPYRHFGADSDGAAWFLICTSFISQHFLED